MYRDDICAVCGDSLPPDHLYCREHAATVDDRLHEIAEVLPRLRADLERAAELIGSIAQETWDYLAEADPEDPDWPPPVTTVLTTDGEDVDVDVDAEPGMVTVSVRHDLATTLSAVAEALDRAGLDPMITGAAAAEDAGATH